MTTEAAVINQLAPQPELACWVQGHEPALSEMTGQVILIEVIQVNCTGCFVHALPEVIRLHETYASQGLKVFGIATAFEHFEHNTLYNLQRLLQCGELHGDPLQQLESTDFIIDGKLTYDIPFSFAMDKLVTADTKVDKQSIERFILSQIPDFFETGWSHERRQSIYQHAQTYLENKTHHALTFEMYGLQGTPSTLLIDKKGILRQAVFGSVNKIEGDVIRLLNEE